MMMPPNMMMGGPSGPPPARHPIRRSAQGSGTFYGMPPLRSIGLFTQDEIKNGTVNPTENLAELEKRYAKYKDYYNVNLKGHFYEAHKAEEWFRFRYSPVHKAEEKEKQIQWAKTEASTFATQMAAAPEEFIKSANLEPEEDGKYTEQGTGGTKKIVVALPEENMEVAEGGEAAPEVPAVIDAKVVAGHGHRAVYIRRVLSWCDTPLLKKTVEAEAGACERIALTDAVKNRHRDFVRTAWIIYPTDQEAKNASRRLHKLKVTAPPGITSHATLDRTTGTRFFELQAFPHLARGYLGVAKAFSVSTRVTHDTKQARKLADALDQAAGIEPGHRLSALLAGEAVQEALSTAGPCAELDVTIAYLRRVHMYLYYFGEQCNTEGELLAIRTHRRTAAYTVPEEEEGEESEIPKRGAEEEKIDVGAAQRLEGIQKAAENAEEENRVLVECQTALDTAVQDWLDSMTIIVPDGENAHARCGIEGCSKLFRDKVFLQKHLRNKHPEKIPPIRDAALLPYVKEAYEADTDKPLPPIPIDGAEIPPPKEKPAESLQSAGVEYEREHHGRRRGRDDEGYFEKPAPRTQKGPPDPRMIQGYMDIDEPKVHAPDLDYGVAFPPPKKKRKADKSSASVPVPTPTPVNDEPMAEATE